MHNFQPTAKMSKKRVRRIAETNELYENAKLESSAIEKLQSRDDSALFSIDRSGSKAGRKKLVTELIPKKENTFVSPTERILINKIIQDKKENKKRKIYGENIVIEKNKKLDINLEDIWGTSPAQSSKSIIQFKSIATITSTGKKRRVEQAKKSLKIALPGQSYHPTVEDHQNVVAEAVAMEIKRQDAMTANALTRPSNILNNKEITAMFLSGENFVPDDSDDNSDNEEYDENALENFDANGIRLRRRVVKNKKMTQAQKNRKRNLRQVQTESRRQKTQEQLLKEIDHVDKYQAELDALEVKKAAEKEIRDQWVATKKLEAESHTLTPKDIPTVPLSDELNGSLRTIKPKGIAVIDRTNAMLDAAKFVERTKHLRKHGENPHGARRVKWIPKYKLPTK